MLTEDDFPPLYHATDASSLQAQRWFLLATRLRLTALVGAALLGLFVWKINKHGLDVAGVLAAIFFLGALLIELFLHQSKPERTWYQGRAAAESVKTLSWRFAVGAEPFERGLGQSDSADEVFLKQLDGLFEVVRDLDMGPSPTSGEQITQAMRTLRASSLEVRKQAYEQGRVHDQQEWYRRKAEWNRVQAVRWTATLLLIDAAGVCAGVMKATGVLGIDLMGFSAAAAAAVLAWLQAKQYRTLATAYSVTQLELASVRSKIARQETEEEWARFVADAEEAFSREHTLWKASRGVQSI